MIYFLHPNPTPPSGGNVYNRHIVERATAVGLALKPVVVAPDAINPAFVASLSPGWGDWLLWDSLFGRQLLECVDGIHSVRHALLLHYLPSENPLLTDAECERLRALERRWFAAVQAVVATGRRLADTLMRRFPGKPVYTVEPGLAAPFVAAAGASVAGGEGGCLQLVTVANGLPAKGHWDVLAVLARLSDWGWRWHLVGDWRVDPPHAECMRRAAEASGLGERIVHHGVLSQDELAKRLPSMQVFVSASYFEAYGMALAEAVAAGLWVVSTRVGEAERLVRHGNNGFLVDVGDRQALHAHLEALFDDPLRVTGARRGCDAPVRSWQTAADEFVAVCRTILAQR